MFVNLYTLPYLIDLWLLLLCTLLVGDAAMLDTLPIVDIASTTSASSSKTSTAGGSGRGLSREALLRNDQMVLTSQLKGDITVAGSMVLAIMEDFGGDLVPIECLYGVVSLERLRKEQKHISGDMMLQK
jgi:hypothetical protein